MARSVRKNKDSRTQEHDESCRLDKWLWAARFFKTRSLAAEAVDGGKVRVNGERTKNAREMKPGMLVSIKHKDMQFQVEILALSNLRRSAPEAALLYRETDESKAARDHRKARGEELFAVRERGTGRPTKRELRDIRRFTGRE